MTYQLDIKKHNEITYLDTPGLSDLELRQKAAKEITRALKQDGTYQVFFVITLEAGRLRPDDLTTIKLVLESAADIKYYSLIINKLSTTVYDGLQENGGEKLKTVISQLLLQTNSNDKPPTILLLKHQVQLYDAKDKFMKLKDLNEFVEKAPLMNVSSASVMEIKDVAHYEKLVESMAQEMKQLRIDKKRMEEQVKEAEKKYFQLVQKELKGKLDPTQKRGSDKPGNTKTKPVICFLFLDYLFFVSFLKLVN